MNKFYSSLIINGKNYPRVHQVFKPRYNKEFFKRVVFNLEQLEQHIERRCKNQTLDPLYKNLASYKDQSHKLVKLKEQLEKLEKNNPEDESKLVEIKSRLTALEERIMPLTISIPNRLSKQVPTQDVIVDQVESNFAASENLFKVLSHTKLAYINNCYSKSVVGPNSHYYYSIGAKLQHGLCDYFTCELEQRDHINVSGLCLTKSAVVEASNSKDLKDYMTDPCRILTSEFAHTTQHLVEASRESLLGFVSTLGPRSSNTPLRLMTRGAGYRKGSSWFDPDERRVSQYETLHALTLNSSIEQYSMKEYQDTTSNIWNLYQRMNLPSRLVHCSMDNMLSNEYDAHRIDIWLPSRHEWLQVSRISHYLDYLAVRIGMKRGHIIDSIVYDGQALFAAIVENNQTSTGKFIIPHVLKDHMSCLNEHEEKNYFRNFENQDSKVKQQGVSLKSGVLNNYEQRRYLAKKSYLFSHSKRADRNKRGTWTQDMETKIFLSFMIMLLSLVDWTEVYIQYFPKSWKRFCYDKIYRKCRRFWRSLTGGGHLEDRNFDELDWTIHEISEYERKRIEFEKDKPKRRPQPTSDDK